MRLLPSIVRSAPRLLLVAVLPVAVARGADAPSPADVAVDADLADRFEALAEITFPARVPTGPQRQHVFAQQAALLRAASSLAPAEPRYPRKLAEALSYTDDPKAQGQFDALGAVLHLQPGDEFTWFHLLDLHVAQYQAAEKQIAYLAGIENVPTLPPAVLAHAGARHAQILFDQGKEKAANALLPQVLVHDPLNLDALHLQYRLLPATATPYVRLQLLLAILKANPLQPFYAREVALTAANAGLVQDALPFFSLSANTSGAQGRPDLATGLDWAAELYIANQNVDAYRSAQNLLSGQPTFSAAWYLDLLIARSSGFPAARQAQDVQRATVTFTNRLVGATNAVLDAGGPATRPAGARATTRPLDATGPVPLPDVSAAVDVLKRDAAATDPNAPELPPAARQQFVEALADLARLDIYFAARPDAATPVLDALRAVLAPADPLVIQLQGLQDLTAGQAANPPDKARLDRARTELAGVAATDPLAAAGLIGLMPHATPAEQERADVAARKLLSGHASGLIGAFLAEALVNPRVKLVPDVQQTDPLDKLIQAFPRDLFAVGTNPQQLYSIHVEPVDVSRSIGQPLLAKVTLFNFSPVDLTIGDAGVIRPGLLFEMAPALGQKPTDYPAVDRLAGPVVLHSRAPFSQVVRVDEPALLAVLSDNVRIQFEIDGQAITNADVGLGGFPQKFTKTFVRAAVNPPAVDVARAQLNGGGPVPSTPRERLVALGVLEAYVREMRPIPNQPPATLAILGDAANLIHRARNDPSPAVAAWAAQSDFALAADADRPAIIAEMANDAANWRTRQLAAVLVAAVPDAALTRRIAEQLRRDPQPSVAQYAVATDELIGVRPGSGTPAPAGQPTR